MNIYVPQNTLNFPVVPESPAPTVGIDSLPGWFTAANLFDRAVRSAPPGALLIEVGVWMGRGLAYLADVAAKADKGLRVVGVDWMRASPEIAWSPRPSDYPNHAEETITGLGRVGALDKCSVIVADSVRAAELFADGSVWFAFIDAAHDKGSVSRDIAAWRPKIAAGGWLAGHDLSLPDVKAAVCEAFGSAWRESLDSSDCWETISH